eukprot:TRINITY_DN990_c0_g2_i1.p1 TRINITY_DN990_c0_g2~~TRINITY_DN990_c0_g2_i1.p1  ORF type:complete len:129 (+),score=2.71 TRINITY_DN990_c0_g2_i1:142-528(+)
MTSALSALQASGIMHQEHQEQEHQQLNTFRSSMNFNLHFLNKKNENNNFFTSGRNHFCYKRVSVSNKVATSSHATETTLSDTQINSEAINFIYEFGLWDDNGTYIFKTAVFAILVKAAHCKTLVSLFF